MATEGHGSPGRRPHPVQRDGDPQKRAWSKPWPGWATQDPRWEIQEGCSQRTTFFRDICSDTLVSQSITMVSKTTELVITNVDGDVKTWEPSDPAGGNVKWSSQGGKCWQFLRKKSTELPGKSTPGCAPRRTENTHPHRNSYTDFVAA